MTTPGGVPNLPLGALTLDTLASRTQDMSGTAMKSRAVERFPSIFNNSTGLDPALDITPFGILTRIWAEVNSLVANSDPADIQGPDDLPPLLLEFIEGLPVVGELVGLLEAILGTYDGDDSVLLAVQDIFAPIRRLMQVIGSGGGVPVGALTNEQPNLLPAGTFPAGSINANPSWTVDTATSNSGDGSGAGRVTADGTMKALRSGARASDTIPVGAGQKITATIRIRHQGYTGTGTAVLLQIVPFTGSTPGSPTAVTFESTAPGNPPQTILVPATYTPALNDLDWPGYLLTGSYVVPEGVTGVQLRIVLTANALTGTFWFDDATAQQSGKLRQEWVDGLPEALQGLGGLTQLIIDTILSALTKTPVVGGSITDLFQMLGLIPPDNVEGAAGPATMFDSVFAIIDAFLAGAVGAPGSTGGSLADVTNVSGQIASQSAQGAFAWQLVNMLNNTPVARGFLPTGRANYDITSANTFLASTQSAALSASFGLLQAMPIGVVSWYGYGSAGMTAFYVNIRKVNLTTGVRSVVHHSANVVGVLQAGSTAADADWMFYEVPTPLAGEATDYFYPEFVPVGGTHFIRGMTSADNIKDHPLSAVPCYGTTVDYSSSPNSPATDLPKATAAPGVPWVEFAVSLAGAADHREPQIFTFADDGESIPIPSWCNRVDAIPLGKGGDGHAGLTAGLAGEPGEPGKFAPVTWERGTDFTGDATLITFNVLSDGSAKVSIPGHDTTAAPGADGAGTKFGLAPVGKGPGVLTYNEQKYAGGVDQKVTGGAGANPGGAGNGGNGFFFQAGGHGGKPAAWVCFRQVEVPGESTGGDTTPPTAPTLTLDDATFSSLTVTASGATDA